MLCSTSTIKVTKQLRTHILCHTFFMNKLRISRHSNMVIGTKQIFKREKIEEEEEAWRVTVSRRKNQEKN